MTALNEEKLQHDNDWWWSNGVTILSSLLSTLVLVAGALIGSWQWRTNRNDTRIKESNDRKEAQDKDLQAQAEERFQAAVTALGSDNEATQVGGAILLRSFLNPDNEEVYGRYYMQIFDLAVAHLRLPIASGDPEDLGNVLPQNTLHQALSIIFKEVFPLVRSQNTGDRYSLNASRNASSILLDAANLARADLKLVWMPGSFLRKANLNRANLTGATLVEHYSCT